MHLFISRHIVEENQFHLFLKQIEEQPTLTIYTDKSRYRSTDKRNTDVNIQVDSILRSVGSSVWSESREVIS